MKLKVEDYLIREYTPDDAAALHHILSDGETMRYIEPPFTLEQTKQFLLDNIGKGRVYALTDKQDRLVGHIIYHLYDDEKYELGWIISRDCRNKGIATKVTHALCARAYEAGAVGCMIECHKDNVISRHIAEKTGFEPEEEKEDLIIYTKPRSSLMVSRMLTMPEGEEKVNLIYEFFHEENRLASKAAQVEFLTTTRFIDRYLKPGMRILNIGAGSGIYSIHYARQGYRVDAIELADRNIVEFKKKLSPELQIELKQGNALNLSAYEDNTFDVVLCFGPLYHLHTEEERAACIREAMRVCKKDGILFFAFIGHDIVFMTELNYNTQYFKTGDYDKETMRLHNFPFVFFTVPECKAMLEAEGLNILRAVASDGFSELMSERINAMDDDDYRQYLRWHETICEKEELLGASNHLLFVCGNMMTEAL